MNANTNPAKLVDDAFDIVFRKARTRNGWTDRPVPESLLRTIYADAIMPPTALNSQPLRVVFVSTEAAKQKLAPALDAGNLAKTMQAPVTAIFAYDMHFYENLAKTFPHVPAARSWFEGNEPAIKEAAFRNASLQAAYFMLAARAHGLDCGPMSGFNQDKVNTAFFPDGRWKANFLCSLGYGNEDKLFPRNPRLGFDETCRIV